MRRGGIVLFKLKILCHHTHRLELYLQNALLVFYLFLRVGRFHDPLEIGVSLDRLSDQFRFCHDPHPFFLPLVFLTAPLYQFRDGLSKSPRLAARGDSHFRTMSSDEL